MCKIVIYFTTAVNTTYRLEMNEHTFHAFIGIYPLLDHMNVDNIYRVV